MATAVDNIVNYLVMNPELTFWTGVAVAIAFSMDDVRRSLPGSFSFLYYTGALLLGVALFYTSVVLTPETAIQNITLTFAESIFFGVAIAVLFRMVDIGRGVR